MYPAAHLHSGKVGGSVGAVQRVCAVVAAQPPLHSPPPHVPGTIVGGAGAVRHAPPRCSCRRLWSWIRRWCCCSGLCRGGADPRLVHRLWDGLLAVTASGLQGSLGHIALQQHVMSPRAGLDLLAMDEAEGQQPGLAPMLAWPGACRNVQAVEQLQVMSCALPCHVQAWRSRHASSASQRSRSREQLLLHRALPLAGWLRGCSTSRAQCPPHAAP